MEGDDAIGAPMLAVQSGVHDVGEPLQLVLPPASYTVRFPSVDPTYSRWFDAAGDAVAVECVDLSVARADVHHAVGDRGRRRDRAAGGRGPQRCARGRGTAA